MKTKSSEPTDTALPTNTQLVTPDGYILKPEVAQRLRKTTRTVEDWMRKGIIPYVKVGNGRRAAVLFRWPEIESRLKEMFGVN